MAYLGKAYLFQGKYSEAANILDKVIASGKYGLYQGDYGDLAHVKANNCRESILESQMRNDPEQMWNRFSLFDGHIIAENFRKSTGKKYNHLLFFCH